MGYSPRQVEALSEVMYRGRLQWLATEAVAYRAAFGADQKTWKEYIDRLENPSEM